MREDLCALWRRYRKTHNRKLRDRLVKETFALVRSVAGHLAISLPPYINLDDLTSAGFPGLLGAINAYDPGRKVDFATYARSRIRGAILDEIRRLDPLSRTLRLKGTQIERATAALEQRLLRAPDDVEIAEAMGISLEELHRTLQDLRGGLQVSIETGWAGIPEAEDVLAVDEPTDPWRVLSTKERSALLNDALADLPENERDVLDLYYSRSLTLRVVARRMHLSESRVSQLHLQGLARLRRRLRRERVAADDILEDTIAPQTTGRLSPTRSGVHCR
jgi:RNA polymerase sigma factor for flagellar operon FliA